MCVRDCAKKIFSHSFPLNPLTFYAANTISPLIFQIRKLRYNLFQVSDRADIENINSLIPEISKINLDLLFS